MDPQQLLTRLRALASSLSPTQLLALAGAFVLVVGIVGGSAWWVNKPSYALLFSDMDPETAGQIVTKLKSQKIAYVLDEGGRGIRVPAERVDELRLDLTSQGMPASGRVGFEIFDRVSFGTTQFLEQVNYRRALEGEIARTISTIGEVATARVHIAMGKDSLFGDPAPAKASVVLKLRGQRSLSEASVVGIRNLVASSVEDLRPESVVVLDNFGRPLSRPQSEHADTSSAGQTERQQRLEHELTASVVAMLSPIVGADRVRVNVALKLNPHSTEETQELWDPNTVVRNKVTSSDQATSASAIGQNGPGAGARANTPPSTAPGPVLAEAPKPASALAATGPSSSRTTETTNYEVSRTTRHTIAPAGDIARLSVAVVLDDDQVTKTQKDGKVSVTHKPRSQAELQKIHGIVAAAVGLEPDRGDQLTVENVAFDEPIIEEGTPPSVLQRYSPQIWEGGRIAVIAILGIAAMFMFVRPLVRRMSVVQPRLIPAAITAAAAANLAAASASRTAADLQSEIEAQIDAAAAEKLGSARLPVLTRRMSAIGTKEPENVAKLLRAWMSEDR